jgi:zinc/manganese transport system substrate-binding protein
MEDEHHPGHQVTDPHAWQSIANAKIYVANIRDGLSKADPPGKSVYEANAKAISPSSKRSSRRSRRRSERFPPTTAGLSRPTTHSVISAGAYGMAFISPEGVSTDAEPSAKDVARIIAQIRKQKIPAVFMENITDPRLMQQIAKETGAKIGGTLYSDALSDTKGPAATYIDMMRSNVNELSKALAPSSSPSRAPSAAVACRRRPCSGSPQSPRCRRNNRSAGTWT